MPPPAGNWTMALCRDCEQVLASQVLQVLQSDTAQFTTQGCTLHCCVARIGLQLASTRVRDCTPPPQVALHVDQLVQSRLVHPWPITEQTLVREVAGQLLLQPASMMTRVLVHTPLPRVTLQTLHALQSETTQSKLQGLVSSNGGQAAPPPDGDCTTTRVRVDTQVALVQLDQDVQADTTQSTGHGEKLHC